MDVRGNFVSNFFRTFLNIVLITFQMSLLIFSIFSLNKFIKNAYLISNLIAICFVLYIVYSKENLSIKLSWIFFIFLFPSSGIIFYLLFGRAPFSKKLYKRIQSFNMINHFYFPQNKDILNEIKDDSIKKTIDLTYLTSNFPVWNNTKVTYLPLGEDMLKSMLKEISKAKKFIFLEYFMVGEGIMLEQIFEVLSKKANSGLDVRIIYDGAGSFGVFPKDFIKRCSKNNITCLHFNPISTSIYNFLSYRDHRKMTIIDGNVAIVGGSNIGDEYINISSKLGHWKDMSLVLEGDAVFSYTVMFIEMWNTVTNTLSDFKIFKPTVSYPEATGYVIPYNDNPFNSLNPAKNIYMSVIANAKDYIYITTPYLIPDIEIITALLMSARAGIDIKIIVPYIGDSKLIHSTTKSFYDELLSSGVEIYEYTPGFIHGKTLISDSTSIVGSINFDYRSLKWNFECATLLYKTESIEFQKQDFIETLSKSKQIFYEDWCNQNIFIKLFMSILKIISPLL